MMMMQRMVIILSGEIQMYCNCYIVMVGKLIYCTRIPTSSQHDQQQVVVAAQSSVPSSLSVLQTVLDISILSCASLLGFTVASSEGGRYISLDTSIIDDNIAIHHDEGILTTTNNNDNTNGYYYLQYFCEATAPLFPLSLFCVLIWKATFPWKIRGNVWFTLIGRTVGAPFYDVTFRLVKN